MQPLEILRFTYGPFAENTYVVVGPSGRRAMIVDPGIGSEPVWDVVRDRGLSVELILNTHGHLDHVACNAFFKRETGAPIAIHPADLPFLHNVSKQASLYGLSVEDSPPADRDLVEGVSLEFDGVTFDVVHTPGHTPGGICLRRGEGTPPPACVRGCGSRQKSRRRIRGPRRRPGADRRAASSRRAGRTSTPARSRC